MAAKLFYISAKNYLLQYNPSGSETKCTQISGDNARNIAKSLYPYRAWCETKIHHMVKGPDSVTGSRSVKCI
jgi:hypothetical protein